MYIVIFSILYIFYELFFHIFGSVPNYFMLIFFITVKINIIWSLIRNEVFYAFINILISNYLLSGTINFIITSLQYILLACFVFDGNFANVNSIFKEPNFFVCAQAHLNTCKHDAVLCAAQCGAMIPRVLMQDHLRYTCPRRRANCEHCHKEFSGSALEVTVHFLYLIRWKIA